MARPGSVGVLFLVVLSSLSVWAGTVTDAISATGVSMGLLVNLPATTGTEEIEAARTNTFLVHGLAIDRAALAASRAAIMGANVYGLASVERASRWDTLAYGDNLVNLLIVDLDLLGPKGLTEAEIERVLVPRGAAYLKKAGSWNVVRKAWDPGLGSWTHLEANCEGSNIGDDKLLRPPTTVKWITNNQWGARMNNSSATGIRVANGKAMYQFVRMRDTQRPKGKENILIGRDAFNGVLAWRGNERGLREHIWESHRFATNGDVLVYFPDTGYAAAIDVKTGAQRMRYSQGLTLETRSNLNMYGGAGATEPQELLICGSRLIESGFERLVVLDVSTGAKVWEYTEPGGLFIGRPIAVESENKIFCTVGEMVMNGGRWPLADVRGVIALDLTSGAEVWRNRDFDSTFSWIEMNHSTPDTFENVRHRIGQLAYHNGVVAFLGPEPLAPANPRLINLGAFDAKTGSLLWHQTTQVPLTYTMAVRNDTIYSMHGMNGIYAYDLRTGAYGDSILDYGKWGDGRLSYQPANKLFRMGYNGRCTRGTATSDYFLIGLVTYVDRDLNWCYSGISRSHCAGAVVPAHGMSYYCSNTCGCNGTALSGFEALKFEKHRPIVDDSQRLLVASDHPSATSLTQSFSTASVVVDDWDTTMQNANYYSSRKCWWGAGAPGPTLCSANSMTAQAGSKTLTAVIHEHRVECTEGSSLVWSYVADGRVNKPPVVFNDLAIFGDHAGYVHAVKITDGSLVWKFMAAASEKKMVAYGQVESCWPVFGVTIEGNTACFSAGRHPEMDGGIFAYGVDAATGALQWKKRVYTPVYVYSAGTRTSYVRTVTLNADSVSKIGIDPGSPADVVGKNTDASGGTPLADIEPVAISRPYTGGTRLATSPGSTVSIKIAGYHGASLVLTVTSQAGHTLRIHRLDGKRIHESTSSATAVYEFTSRMLPAGTYVVSAVDRARGEARVPVTVLW